MRDLEPSLSSLLRDNVEVIHGAGCSFWLIGPELDHEVRRVFGRASFILAAKHAKQEDGASEALRKCILVGQNPREELQGLDGSLPFPYEVLKPFDARQTLPLKKKDARQILADFLQIRSKGSLEKCPPLLAMCSGNAFGAPVSFEYLGIASMGGHEPSSSLQYRTYNIARHIEPSLNLEAYMPALPSGPQNVSFLASYDACLLQSPDNHVQRSASAAQSIAVNMDVLWRDHDLLCRGLRAPPPRNAAAAVLSVAPAPSDPATPVYAQLAALRRLLALNKARDSRAEGLEEWPCELEHQDPVFLRVEKYLEGERQIASRGGVVAPDESTWEDDDSGLGMKSVPPRHDLDFTERLWLFLKDAADEDDLRKCMAEVFACLQQDGADHIQPMIHKSNHTALGLLLREAIKLSSIQTSRTSSADEQAQLKRTFNYWLTEPLECLVDIGIYHMHRNYSAWLMQKNLSSYTQISWFMDPGLDMGEQIERLQLLHLALDAVMLANNNGTPYDSLRTLCGEALGHFRARRESEVAGEDIDLDALDEELLEGMVQKKEGVDLLDASDACQVPVFQIVLPVFARATTMRLMQIEAKGIPPKVWVAVRTSSSQHRRLGMLAEPAVYDKFSSVSDDNSNEDTVEIVCAEKDSILVCTRTSKAIVGGCAA